MAGFLLFDGGLAGSVGNFATQFLHILTKAACGVTAAQCCRDQQCYYDRCYTFHHRYPQVVDKQSVIGFYCVITAGKNSILVWPEPTDIV
ncbi:hypothetical protein RC92_14720 [Pectobacterium brasiliense]|nr:hypothetical protein RC92_14720 [Pectobacterium brasiliense]